MDEIQGSTLVGSINGNLPSSATIVSGKVKGALYTNGLNQVVNYGNHRTQCYHQPDMCTEGVTFSMWLKIMSSKESVILDCGGFHGSAIGYAMRRQASGKFRVGVIERTHMSISDILQWKLDEWAHLVMTYEFSAGVLLYMNGCQLGLQWPRKTRSRPISFLPDFFIGGASYISTMNAKMAKDNMLIWHQILDGEEVWQLYMQGGVVIWFNMTCISLATSDIFDIERQYWQCPSLRIMLVYKSCHSYIMCVGVVVVRRHFICE